MRRLLGFIMAVAAGTIFQNFDARASTVSSIDIKGVIGPATANYIARAIQVATARNDVCLIIHLDTPGGLLDSTKEIVHSLYSASLPVVVYVSPSGAGATSAGCFITLAADVAAMAPHTTIGAAHVVLSGGGGAEKLDDVMKEKLEKTLAIFASGSGRPDVRIEGL